MSILASIKKIFTGQKPEPVQQANADPDQEKTSELFYIAGIQEERRMKDQFFRMDAHSPIDDRVNFGGLDYYEVTDTLRGIADRGEVVGFDFCEVAPMYDPTGVTCQVAARIILDFIGAIFSTRKKKT